MKKLLPLLVVLLAPVAVFAAGFEGKITMNMSRPKDAPTAMTFSLKDGFSRMDMSGGAGRNVDIILDSAKQEMTILMVEQKMFMTRPMPAPQATTTGGGGDVADVSVEVTTTKEKILGYDCVKYVAKSKDGTSEIWATDQLGAFLGMGGGSPMGGRRGPGTGAPPPQGWESAMLGKNVFPLRVVTSQGGKESFRLEATAVEKQTLPEGTFSVPADFKNLSEMMRGMGMPGGIPGMPGGMKIPGRE